MVESNKKMNTKMFSIVGTDTGIGKTYVSVEILHYLNKHGLNASALKPISAGIGYGKNGLFNEDVEKLLNASKTKLSHQQISPFALKLPIAPHIGAEIEEIALNVNEVTAKIEKSIQLLSNTADYILIEGVGGIMVPLNADEAYTDLLKAWQYPTILVVGMKLGCLNHACLTAEALLEKNINVVGWVANCVDKDMAYLTENIKYLTQKLTMPLLGTVAYETAIMVNDSFKEVFACS